MPARTRGKAALPLPEDSPDDVDVSPGNSEPVIHPPGENEEDDSGSDAPEEESNTASRSKIRATEMQRRSEMKKKQDDRRKTASVRQRRNEQQQNAKKQQQKERREIKENEERQTDEERSGDTHSSSDEQSNRLDPALFASAFAAPRKSNSAVLLGDLGNESKSTTTPSLREAAERRRQEKRRGGIVKGRDGNPMRRVEGTTVRVLAGDGKPSVNTVVKDMSKEEVLAAPMPVDDIEARPNARARAFKKRRLGLQGKQIDAAGTRASVPKNSKGKGKKSYSDDDDPLGLEDPAFMKGGEFANLFASSRRKRNRGSSSGMAAKSTGANARATELRGADAGRRKGTQAISRNGGPMHFARQR